MLTSTPGIASPCTFTDCLTPFWVGCTHAPATVGVTGFVTAAAPEPVFSTVVAHAPFNVADPVGQPDAGCFVNVTMIPALLDFEEL